ncbi:MAG: hypothetical protein ACYCSS_08200 [Sulfuriferula sp.]
MHTSSDNAISLLTKNHAEVKSMFQEFESLTDRTTVSQKKIASQVCLAHPDCQPSVAAALKYPARTDRT